MLKFFYRLKNAFHTFINKGIDKAANEFEVRVIKYINLLCFYAITFFIPFLLVKKLIAKQYLESLVITIALIVFIITIYLNRKGKNQLALLVLGFGTITLSHIVVYINTIQTAAPYIAIIIGISSIFFIKQNIWRKSLFILSFLSFIYLNYIQLTTRVFDLTEFIVSVLLILLLAIGMRFVNQMRNVYETTVLEQKKKLEEQNKIISDKSETVIQLQKDKHEQELLLKQKDLEMTLANNKMQSQLNKNLVDKLKQAQRSGELEKSINQIILELYHQNEINTKMNFIQENIHSINTSFFDNLQQAHPNITRVDREFCSYIKLGLTSKEIAVIRNTTVNTINVAKTRLRKKFNLPKNSDIQDYLRTL